MSRPRLNSEDTATRQRGLVAMAGATGFTGRRVARRLADAGERLRCLVRPTSPVDVLPPGAATVVGDLADPEALDELLRGAEVLVYCASMGFGHAPGVVAACERAQVQRGVFLSTTAIFTRLPAPSKAVRTAAEDAVRKSVLQWTIVRPTMIYGAPGDRNFERLLSALRRWPLLPLPGAGGSLIQPVHVDDLAQAVAASVRCRAATGRAYEISGREPLSFRQAVAQAAQAVGRRRGVVPLPLSPLTALLGLSEWLGVRLPIRREQLLRLAEDKSFAHHEAARDLGFAPRPFAQGILEEAVALGLAPNVRRAKGARR